MMFTNQMRFTGMSGLDVNDMVTQLMRAHSMRLDRVRQNRDVIRWQQEKQRGVATQMRALQREFLTATNPSRNLLFPSNFQARSTNITANTPGANANGIRVTTTNNTPLGNNSIQVHSVASNDVFRSEAINNLNNGITGSAFNVDNFRPLQEDARNMNQWATDLGAPGSTHMAWFNAAGEVVDPDTDGAVQLAARFNDDGDSVRVAGRLIYLRGGEYTDPDGYRLDDPYPDGQRMRQQVTHNGGLNFRVTVNGNTQTVYIPASAMFYTNPDGSVPRNDDAVLRGEISTASGGFNAWLENQINSVLSSRFGYDGGNANVGNSAYRRVSVSISTDSDGNGVMNLNNRPGHTVAIANTNGRPSLASIGFNPNGQSTTTSLSSITMEDFMGNDNGAFNFNINGRTFAFDGTSFRADGRAVNFGDGPLTLQQVINTINGANTGASINFNATTNRFTFQSNQTGVHNSIEFSSGTFTPQIPNPAYPGDPPDPDIPAFIAGPSVACTFFERIGFGNSNATSAGMRTSTASDAVVTVNGNRFERTTNSFEIDGLQITLNPSTLDLSDGPVSFNVNIQQNTSHTMDLIRNFVEEYNNLIRSIRDLTHTRAPRSSAPGRRGRFLPLTEDQRREMSDREIELWEEQARTGILHRDRTLQNLTSRLHREIFRDVQFPDGRRLNLLHLGIRTDSDLQNFGELQINEERLQRWLDERPEDVMQLFTQADNRLAGENNTQNRPGRLHNSGIAARINDIINWELMPGGGLFEHAGVSGTLSDGENRLSNRITSYEQRVERMLQDLARREQRYFMMFSRLENALTAGQNQMMFLEQMIWAG